MGLAGRFSEEGYVCKTCGHKSEGYSPNCPNCWKGSLKQIQSKRQLALGFKFASQGEDNKPKARPAAVGGAIAALLVVVAAIAVVFFHRPDQSAVKPIEVPAQPAKVPVRHVRHIAPHPVARAAQTSRPRNGSPGGVAPSHVTPMKLWEVNKDADE